MCSDGLHGQGCEDPGFLKRRLLLAIFSLKFLDDDVIREVMIMIKSMLN